jgi:hypothetical protein
MTLFLLSTADGRATHHDAAPRTLVPLRPDELQANRPVHRRSRPMAKDVPECSELRGLSLDV